MTAASQNWISIPWSRLEWLAISSTGSLKVHHLTQTPNVKTETPGQRISNHPPPTNTHPLTLSGHIGWDLPMATWLVGLGIRDPQNPLVDLSQLSVCLLLNYLKQRSKKNKKRTSWTFDSDAPSSNRLPGTGFAGSWTNRAQRASRSRWKPMQHQELLANPWALCNNHI